MKTSVSIIIPVYNDMERLRVCLEALEEQVVQHGSCEVLVVDNGSDEDVGGRLGKLPGVRVLREDQPGSYAARNRAIREARGDILAFTDADCIPEPDWIKNGIAHLDARPETSLVAGRVIIFARDPDHPAASEIYEILKAFPQETYANKHGFAATANLFVRRHVFDEVGPFRDHAMSGGDREFGVRASSAGFKIDYAPNVIVRHPGRPTLRALVRKMKRTLAGIRDLQSEGFSRVPGPPALLPDLAPPVPSMLRALREPRLRRFRLRCKYAYAILYLHYARAWLRFSLARGAASPR